MQMRTYVSEGATTFSGGQRQRLLIARAVVAKPRILFFDEATSALDNHTQAHVADAIGQLRATRIVIAHRLSTIRFADQIIVVDGGRVVQAGGYEELLTSPGPFARLAKRQLVTPS
jgi:ABC-type bacteriocin/lantibiotic exporter with double-glycine peptidase domain